MRKLSVVVTLACVSLFTIVGHAAGPVLVAIGSISGFYEDSPQSLKLRT